MLPKIQNTDDVPSMLNNGLIISRSGFIYVNISGVTVKITPDQPTVWKKYSINTTTNYMWNKYNINKETKWAKYYASDYYEARLLKVIYGNQYNTAECNGGNVYFARDKYRIDNYTGYGFSYNGWTQGTSFGSDGMSSNSVPASRIYGQTALTTVTLDANKMILYVSSNDNSFNNNTYAITVETNGDVYAYDYYNRHRMSDNTVVLGYVTSSNENAYPTSGYQNGYWYSIMGTIDVRGSYLGSTTAANKNKYPTNGISGSYWYVYVGENTINSPGNFIDTVSSFNSAEYPSNGVLGEYWYIKQ